jgi:ligand-binding sensor domain-containing protein
LAGIVWAKIDINKDLTKNEESNYNVTFHNLLPNFHFRATRSILRDHKGLMWFGTENGLVRFDGINLKVYEHDLNNPRSIHYNTVNTLFEDKNNKLWIGTSKGLNFYNRQNNNFERVDTSSQEAALLNQSYISSISAGNDSLFGLGHSLKACSA